MSALKKIIRQRITADGPMGVDEFMGLALGHPEHGYYMTRDPFGRAGDFTTAPEISQMFGELLGLWTADVWMKLGHPEKFDFIECGPGRGTLMADALRATKKIDGFHAAAQIVLMEISSVLKEKQKTALKDFNVLWIDSLDQLISQPSNHPIILLANEFLDALPVQQFQFEGGEWQERCIGINSEDALSFSMSFRRKPGYISLPEWIPACAGMTIEEGGVIESSPVREKFVQDVAGLLKSRCGAALFIDYGHEGGVGDTLQAVKNHKFVSVFEDIGNADLTSHVDFSALKNAAHEVTVYGPEGQGDFLEKLGIRARAEKLNQHKELDRLTAPGQMGRLFKAMALCHDVVPEGF